MRIIKTSKQARAERAAIDAAYEEMRSCPECGHDNVAYIGIPFSIGKRHVYRATCPYCGCEWESSEF